MFRNETTGGREQDKLVDLFRNRAELKKEFAVLRDEKYKLQDRVKQIVGETARVEQKLDHVENLLLDPDWVLNIAAFYQLRALARRCAQKLQRFAEQLKQQHEKQQHSEVLAVWGRQRREKQAVVERKIGEHRMTMQLLEDQLESERHHLKGMGKFMKWFGRRAVAREIQNIGERIAAGQVQDEELLKELQSIANMEQPTQRGLEVGMKRSINIKILCFAQQLYLQFDDEKLLQLAKEASQKGVGTVKYGSNQVCVQILAALERARRDNQFSAADADMLKKRLVLISQCAEYQGAEDAVPMPASVAKVFAFDAAGEVTETDANILGDNYFSIGKVLSR
jgi:hypothetical protein